MTRRELFLRLLDTVSLKTFTLLDIGARGGIHERWEPPGDRLQVLAFELDESCFDSLQREGRVRAFSVALGNSSGKAQLRVLRNAGCSSIYPPSRRFLQRFPDVSRFDVIATETIRVERLDRVLDGAEWNPSRL